MDFWEEQERRDAELDYERMRDEKLERLQESNAALLDILKRILRAHDTGNCGATIGEAKLCPMYADMARDAITKAEGGQG